MGMKLTEQIDGYFLSFDKRDIEAIRENLEYSGYKADGDGLKEYIVDTLAGEPEEDRPPPRSNLADMIEEYIRNNPEKIALWGNAARNVFEKMKKARR